MKMPGFTAEASLYWVGVPYHLTDTPIESRGDKAVTAQRWRIAWCEDEGCVACDEFGNCRYVTHTEF
jgi:hypothetical protein